MEFLKFTKTFLDSLSLTSSTHVNLDNVLQGNLKNFLFTKRSFALNQEELNEVKLNIEETFNHFLQVVLPEYLEADKLTETKTKLHTRDFTQNYGNEKIENSSFEPVVNNTQAETKQSGQSTSWQPDVSSETIDEEEFNDSPILKEFYNGVYFKIPMFFGRYVNNLLFGGE